MDLNRFLLDLYRLAPGTPTPEFSDAVLERLKGEITFDGALWATFTGTPAGPRGHSVHLHHLPIDMLAEYERVKHLDVLNAKLIERPGRTVAISLAQARARGAHRDVIVHARKWAMEQTLATVTLESPLNLYTIVSLYRRDQRAPFGERERRFKQAVTPHLVAAWHMNAIHFLAAADGSRPSTRRARALVDSHGLIHNAEAGLPELLQTEIEGWTGPVVPAALLDGIQSAQGRFDGNAVVATRLRALDDRTLVVQVRLRAPADALSEREHAVAREFASGKTHKEIAKLLGTSPATVRSQIQAAYLKLGVGTKVDLGKRLDEAR